MTNRRVAGGRAVTDSKCPQPSAGTYMLAASEAEHARLIEIAQRNAPTVREMCARAGVGAGARVVEVGCGPVGALLELAEIAGPQGTVVGLDSSAAAVATARDCRRAGVEHGRDNPRRHQHAGSRPPHRRRSVRRGAPAARAGPSGGPRRDAAPGSHAAAAGGRVLISDVLAPPRYDPPVPASDRAWELLQAAGAARGLAQPVGYWLPRLCADAGLRVLDARGYFDVPPLPRTALAVSRVSLLSTRAAIVGAGLATEAEIDGIAAALTAAESQEFRSAVGYLLVQVIAAVPQDEELRSSSSTGAP